jgi:hypothetical protein
VSCGADAERRYSDMSSAEVVLDEQGYRLRYPAPWKRIKDDPLEKGTRTTVQVGGARREIVAGSATVLQVSKETNAPDPDRLSVPKYRLEAVLLRCSEEELADAQDCAEALAKLDQAGLEAEGDFDRFGKEPRAGKNDFDQPLYELLGQLSEDRRYRRVVFYAGEDAALTVRLMVEGNPDLGEREITRMVQAFELTNPEEP